MTAAFDTISGTGTTGGADGALVVAETLLTGGMAGGRRALCVVRETFIRHALTRALLAVHGWLWLVSRTSRKRANHG